MGFSPIKTFSGKPCDQTSRVLTFHRGAKSSLHLSFHSTAVYQQQVWPEQPCETWTRSAAQSQHMLAVFCVQTLLNPRRNYKDISSGSSNPGSCFVVLLFLGHKVGLAKKIDFIILIWTSWYWFLKSQVFKSMPVFPKPHFTTALQSLRLHEFRIL